MPKTSKEHAQDGRGIRRALCALAVLATITHQTFAAGEGFAVRKLTQQALADTISRAMLFRLEHQAEFSRACAIPLLEARIPATTHIDPMSRPAPLQTFDKMARPAEVKACPRP